MRHDRSSFLRQKPDTHSLAAICTRLPTPRSDCGAGSGEDAVTLLQGKNTSHRALVTDINLSGRIDGWEIARVAREVDPSFPIVI
jgi:DNA-binding LytR/AlgR family response regulator